MLTETGEFAYSTYLGGSNFDGGYGLGLDDDGNVYLGGQTSDVQSLTFPITGGVYQATPDPDPDNYFDGFVTKFAFDPQLGYSLDWSTYLSGAGSDAVKGLAVDGSGNTYPTGETTSDGFLGAQTGDISGDAFGEKSTPPARSCCGPPALAATLATSPARPPPSLATCRKWPRWTSPPTSGSPATLSQPISHSCSRFRMAGGPTPIRAWATVSWPASTPRAR